MYTFNDIIDAAGEDIAYRLLNIIKKEYLVKWFYLPNPNFNNKTPFELCREGNKSQLEEMCHRLESGEPQ
jgi:hypothetical protein